MKVIIDIPDNVYEWVKNTGKFGLYHFDTAKAIKNGTPLPKGHGKIIDVNEAINYIDDYAFGFFSFDYIPAVIEADTESEDVVVTNKNLCDSCTNKDCIFQSGIVRNRCDFYRAKSEVNYED